MFCLLYALVGIPIMIVFTASIGDLMADALRWIYSRVCCRWCRVRRRDNEIIDGIERKKELLIISDEVGKDLTVWKLWKFTVTKFLKKFREINTISCLQLISRKI